MKAMILAAGRGERLRPITDSTPKPLVDVGGKSLLKHHIDKLAESGIRQLVINHAHLGEQIVAAFGSGDGHGVEIHYSAEQPALETGGAVIKALSQLGDAPFAVINGDVYTEYDFVQLPQLQGQQLAHLLLVPNPEHNPQGDFSVADGLLRPKGDDSLTFSGIGVYHPSLFEGLEVTSIRLPEIWADALVEGRIAASVISDYWCDVGTLERLTALRERLVGQSEDTAHVG
ncbi:N-acetylmuramate alpha-1-phosphate uridylyltransferase MurU [Paraferrimonas sedimenticola]|uniref:Mannose-1-phosphate guanylyltransferase n=1 Tax=Paraferrimonas sedimenticola TaxID=375674 RepID=A0AA37RY23_9GAMM|nr:nucleotidyltransferase family protein [Paraferrimonas sedimenticola]GLP97338.1 mannose-1-phosphate guanylyltransferase [Paraferrimonas sedimenticola]